MESGIYLIDDGELVEMTEKPYDEEAILQESLANYPRLLAGDQMNVADPRRWALIGDEVPVPDTDGGGDRWSADHLFVDQDGIPTIVEVKRSSDTRSRREVVGQMLDYASHGRLYWERDTLLDHFIASCDAAGRSPEQVLAELGGEDSTLEAFFETIEQHLTAGTLRLLFVADVIHTELRRIVEFLNEGMESTEVLAIEVKQYTSDRQQAFVPRLIGQTEEARQAKASTTRPSWDEDEFHEQVVANAQEGTITEGEADAMLDLYEFIQTEADSYDFGGSSNVSVIARWEAIGGGQGVFTLNTTGYVSFWQPAGILTGDRYDVAWTQAELDSWYAALGAIDHPAVPDTVGEDTKFSTEALVAEDHRNQFKSAVRSFVAACEAAAN